MEPKETWVDETLNSLDGIRRAQPDPGIFIWPGAKPATGRNMPPQILRPVFWRVAAGIALLIALNILGAIHFRNTHVPTPMVSEGIVSDYLYYLEPVNL